MSNSDSNQNQNTLLTILGSGLLHAALTFGVLGAYITYHSTSSETRAATEAVTTVQDRTGSMPQEQSPAAVTVDASVPVAANEVVQEVRSVPKKHHAKKAKAKKSAVATSLPKKSEPSTDSSVVTVVPAATAEDAKVKSATDSAAPTDAEIDQSLDQVQQQAVAPVQDVTTVKDSDPGPTKSNDAEVTLKKDDLNDVGNNKATAAPSSDDGNTSNLEPARFGTEATALPSL